MVLARIIMLVLLLTISIGLSSAQCEPVCDKIGTRAEGWYDSCTMVLIKYDSCSRCTAICKEIGTRSEGWYSSCDDSLIKFEKCSVSATRTPTPTPTPTRITPTPTPTFVRETPTPTPYRIKCEDYCSNGVYYYDGKYNSTTGRCEYLRLRCEYGCNADGTGCAMLPAYNETPKPVSTLIPTLVPTQVEYIPTTNFTYPISLTDSDNDNVPDVIDLCPNTPLGEFSVDENGCPPCKIDTDGDNPFEAGSVGYFKWGTPIPTGTNPTDLFTPLDFTLPVNDKCIDDKTLQEYYCNVDEDKCIDVMKNGDFSFYVASGALSQEELDELAGYYCVLHPSTAELGGSIASKTYQCECGCANGACLPVIDTDGDGIADCNDNDDDNDGVLDIIDNCPMVYNPSQADSNNNGVGEMCEDPIAVWYPENFTILLGFLKKGSKQDSNLIRVFSNSPNDMGSVEIEGKLDAYVFRSDKTGPLQNPPDDEHLEFNTTCDYSIIGYAYQCNVEIAGFGHPNFKLAKIEFKVKAYAKNGQLVAEEKYEKTYFPEGDLDITNFYAVQVVYGSKLIKGKNTAFKVKLNSTFNHPVEVKFKLDLVNGWQTDYYFPKIWGPIKIPANAVNYEVMLPIIPDWQRDDPYSNTNPAGWISAGQSGSLYSVPYRNLPYPVGDGYNVCVYVDPQNEVIEDHEGNNGPVCLISPHGVITTKGFKVLFTLWLYNHSYDYWLNQKCAKYGKCVEYNPDGSCAKHNWCACDTTVPPLPSNLTDICNRLHKLAKESTEYLLGVYPVSDRKIFYGVDCTVHYKNDKDKWEFLSDLLADAKSDGYDAVVAVKPWNKCGISKFSLKYAAYCSLDTEPMCPAHEFGHSIEGMKDCYKCVKANTCPGNSNCDSMPCCEPISCDVSDGFWVNKWIKYESGLGDPKSYMRSLTTVNNVWIHKDPQTLCDGTPLNGGYDNLINIFYDENDPQVIIVRGSIDKNGSAELDPFIITEGYVDLKPNSTGNYYIVLLNDERKAIGKYGFNVDFYEYGPEGEEEIDKAYFVYRVEWNEKIRRIELQDSEGKVIVSRNVSLNKPEIKLIYPNGSEVFKKGEKIEIKWVANDKDGDELTFTLSISKDGGETWLPIDIDIKTSEYVLDTRTLEEGDKYVIKVKATDGVNTAEDTSDAYFTILENEKTSKKEVNKTSGTTPIQTKQTPGFEVFQLLTAIVVVYLIKRRIKGE